MVRVSENDAASERGFVSCRELREQFLLFSMVRAYLVCFHARAHLTRTERLKLQNYQHVSSTTRKYHQR